MTTDIKELVKRLRDGFITMECEDDVVRYTNHAAADALEAMAGEVENQKCFAVTEQQRAELAEAERDRLKNALRKKLSAKARQKLGDLSESMIAMGDGHSLEMLLNWYDESRKALGGDA